MDDPQRSDLPHAVPPVVPPVLATPNGVPLVGDPAEGADHRGFAGSVLAIPVFRHVWTALSLASMGDWLGLLALTAYAQLLSEGYTTANLAVSVVFLLRLAPAIVLGPVAGVVADRLDRRHTMVAANAIRFVLIASIPVVHRLWWVFLATLLVECASLFFIPAKEATVPNLVPRERLQAANQLNLAGTYGSAPVAAVVFILLSLLGRVTGSHTGFRGPELALYINALTFLLAAVVIARLSDFPARAVPDAGDAPAESPLRAFIEGWRYVGTTAVVRGIVVAMLGAFAAGGAVIGLARTYVRELGGGDAAYGVLFAAVFLGMAAGMGIGPRLVSGFSRRRLLGLTICGAGIALGLLAIVPNLAVVVVLTVVVGSFAGLSWVTGYTLLGLEVGDEVRGRVFATLQLFVRVVLVAVLTLAPLIAGAIGRHRLGPDSWDFTLSGASITLLVAGVLAAVLGVASFRAMDDRAGMPLVDDVVAVMRGSAMPVHPAAPAAGFFLALEGGEGSGKSTLAERLAVGLRARGHEVLVTREPGATPVGARLRQLLLDPATGRIDPRTEALLYAADRAEHVATVIRPALERAAIVISDRYADSSIAYQGAGRALAGEEIAWLSSWAANGLTPSVTVLLDVAPILGLARAGAMPDRVEAEPREFHERVRRSFLALSQSEPARYVVVDAGKDVDEVQRAVVEALRSRIPLSPRELEEREARRLLQEKADREAREAAEREQRRLERERAAQLEAERQARAELERERAQQEHERVERERRAALAERERLEELQRAEAARREALAQTAATPVSRNLGPPPAASVAPDAPTSYLSVVPAAPADAETAVFARPDFARPSAPSGSAALSAKPPASDRDEPVTEVVDLRSDTSLTDELFGWTRDRQPDDDQSRRGRAPR